jgi:tRNA(Ile)-lysidine synthase
MSNFESSPVSTEFNHQLQVNQLSGKKVIAGVSGGPDSMAMLYLFHRFDMEVTAVHCNYGLRGEASDKDQQLVEEMCSLWGMECVSVRLEPDEKHTGNFQNWARKRRYRVFEDLQTELSADLIATAHHQDDQIETILQKILRGASLTGWKGMSVLSDGLFRPLLNVSKKDILRFVEEYNIPYRIDGSNEESTYARNFLRQNWFPELHRFFPGWRQNIMKLTRRADEFEIMCQTILTTIIRNENQLDREAFLKLDETIQPVILHQFIRQYAGAESAGRAFLDYLEPVRTLQTGKRIQVAEEIFICRDRDLFLIEAGSDNQPADTIVLHREDLPVLQGELKFKEEEFDGSFSTNTLSLDADQIAFPVAIRPWEPGDQFRPLGMEGTQKVSDHLTHRKVSSTTKADARVIKSFDGNLIAVIFPLNDESGEIGTISEVVRCRADTKTIFKVCKT